MVHAAALYLQAGAHFFLGMASAAGLCSSESGNRDVATESSRKRTVSQEGQMA
jgi:hypothetical protein